VISGKFLTAANIVSILRVPLTLAACYFLRKGPHSLTLAFMVMAILSDAVDGWLARKTGTVSDWGKILDPLADKISFAVFAVTLLVMHLIPFWIFAVLAGRDLLIVAGGLLMSRKRKPPSANIWGKLSTMVLSFFMLRQALFPLLRFPEGEVTGTDVLGVLAVVLIVLSFITYAYSFIRSGRYTNEA
jgi:CDP-diacylglycerol--glycerol-3-phosphate 3-phosphatidyltransferase